MKKIISIALSLALILLVVPMAIYAEGATLTVGANGDYATIAEAVAAASAGDTVQLVDDIVERQFTISKALTIDTNGHTWTAYINTAENIKKANCATLSANVTIKNSQRTTQITADATPDIIAKSVKHNGVFVIGKSGITVTFDSVVVNSVNTDTNNYPCALYAGSQTATVNINNSYLTSTHYASIVTQKCALTLNAENSIFDGKVGTYVTRDADKGSNIYFKNCELLKTIGHVTSSNTTSATNGTASLPSLNITFEGCTGAGVYGAETNVKFVGTNAVDTVYADVVVAAGEGTTLYADSAYTTEVASGTITANTAIYSKGEGTDEEESSSEVVEPEEPSSEPEVPSESETESTTTTTTTTTTTVPTPSTPVESGTLTVGATLGQYKTIADAVAAANAGDTIKFVENVHEEELTISKAVTIDTNGFVWTAGTASSNTKRTCAYLKANVTITNSKRTSQVTANDSFDVEAYSTSRGGMFVIGANSVTVTFKNININSINPWENNQGCAVYSNGKTANVIIDNCYMSSIKYSAIVVQKSTLTLTATNSIFGGGVGSYVTCASDNGSTLNFKKCTFLKTIGQSSANVSTSATNGTTSLANLNITLEDCTGTGIYGPDANVKFVGTNAFTNVYAGVKVSCADGDAIYTDADYVNQLVSGTVLAENSAIYSKTLPTEFHIYIDGEKYATVDVGASYTLPVSEDNGLIAYTDGTTYYAENQVVTPEINMNLTSVSIGDVKMLQGASMKLNVATGLRFYTQIDIEKINALQEDGAVISMGTLIAPENLLNGEALTLDIPEDNRLNVSYEIGLERNLWFEEGNFKGMVGSIANIKESNMNRRFVGRGYVTVTLGDVTKTVYADYANDDISNNTRTVSFIANALKNDANNVDLYEEYKSIVDEIAAKYDVAKEF